MRETPDEKTKRKSEPPHVGCYTAPGGSSYLPRLERSYYQGNAAVHWTQPIAMRRRGWLTQAFHARFREVMLHTAAREGLLCAVYCLMPDHLHHIWIGARSDSDQRRAIAFLRTHLGPALAPMKFQHQAHDHVLRDEDRRRDAFVAVCRYIRENPMRAGLCDEVNDWEYGGALVPGYPRLDPREPDYWERFWKIYEKLVAADVRMLIPPPERGAKPKDV